MSFGGITTACSSGFCSAHSVGMRGQICGSSSLRARRVNVVDRFRRVHFRMNQTTASTNVNRPARVKSFDRIKNTTEEYQALRPSIQQLRMVAFQAGVPFIGFGFVDNLIMILAGDYIDVTFGVAFGISTIAAAGLGNLISDVAGVGLGGIIESWTAKLGLATARLTPRQAEMTVTIFARNWGCAIGVSIGCLLGMVPLLFMDTSKSDVLREQKAVETIFTHVMDYVHGAAGCQKATLYLTDSENFELWTIAAVGENRIRMPLNQGLAGKSVTLDKTLNVADAYESPDFSAA